MALDLYLIRHAQSESNTRPHIIGGRSNHVPLSRRGEQEAHFLGERLRREGPFDNVYSSTAVRAVSTMQICARYMPFPLERVVLTDALLELDQGDWQGRERSLTYTHGILSQIQQSDGHFSPPNGESQRAVERRMSEWLQPLRELQQTNAADRKVAVFGHGMAFKCLLRGIMGFPPTMTYRIKLGNTSITRLRYENETKGWSILAINDTAHLQHAGVPLTYGVHD